jgi:hypothetical protein
MKKLLFLIMALSLTFTASAQYRDVKLPEKPKQTAYPDFERQNAGFWFSVDLEGGSSIMSQKTNTQYVNLAWTGGYRFSEFLRVGAGVGGRMYVHNAWVRGTDNKFSVPIFANIRGNLMSAYDIDGVPYWSLNVGGITNEGFFFNPTVGYSFGGWRNNFLIGISYTLTSLKYEDGSNVAYSFFGLKIGYEF